jgi:MYXO-CTERM domain-containing protein
MRHTDGKYYVAYTDPPGAGCCGKEDHFRIAQSADLVHWTNLTTVPGAVPGLAHVRAPEWFVDGGVVMVIANIDTRNTDSDFKPCVFTALDDSLTSWSGPTAVGIGPNHIDTFVLKVKSTYHLFSKNETTRYDDTWRIYLDGQGSVGFLYSNSSDLMTWSKTSLLPVLSNVVRHGTVIRDEPPAGGGGGGSGGAGGGGGGSAAGGSEGGGGDAGGTGGAGHGGAAGAGTGGAGGLRGGGAGAGGGETTGAAGAVTATGAGGTPSVHDAGTPGAAGATGATGAAGAVGGPSPDSSGCQCSTDDAPPSPAAGLALALVFAAVPLRTRSRPRPRCQSVVSPARPD